MKRASKIPMLPLILALALGLLAHDLASADQSTQKTTPSVQDTDLSVSPFKGPAEAPVVIFVFSDFQ